MKSQSDPIIAFEPWWNTRPEPHISAPKECYVQQDKVMAIWLSAWDAAQKAGSQNDE